MEVTQKYTQGHFNLKQLVVEERLFSSFFPDNNTLSVKRKVI